MNRFKLILSFHVFFLCIFVCIADIACCEEPVPGAGDFLQIALPVAGLGFTFINDDEEGRLQLYKSALSCFSVTYGLKLAIHEERPNGGDYYSFPSGHTSAGFFGASFIQRRYGWEYGVPAYLLASYVGWSRVDKKAHYVHDVLAGAAIGVVSSYLFTTPISEKVDVVPLIGENSFGVGFSFKW